MIGTSIGAVLDGIEKTVVHVEADVGKGLPQFSIVGLPDSAVRESKLRIRSAIRNSGLEFPSQRITVNLSPASTKKRGAGLDLAIAIAILRATGQIPERADAAYCAELSLSGQLVPVPGMVNLALACYRAGIQAMVVSEAQADCVPIGDLEWYCYASLRQIFEVLAGRSPAPAPRKLKTPFAVHGLNGDMADVLGLEEVKEGLAAAAVGRLHVLLVGPPGCGKTMTAERFPSILPYLSEDEALEVYALHQAAGLGGAPSIVPPLRNPHHSITSAGLVGGTNSLSPGEATLAHRGVLLLDELLEFSRHTLEALREPLTHKQVRLTRGGRTAVLPADFQLFATMNPCPCGFYGTSACNCGQAEVLRYWSRLSGPLMDRIDIVLRVQPTRKSDSQQDAHSSQAMRARVEQGRRILHTAAHHASAEKSSFTRDAWSLLQRSRTHIHLSERGWASVLRVCRSVAALHGSDIVRRTDVEAALALRSQIRPSRASRM